MIIKNIKENKVYSVKLQRSRGFALLYAVVISSIILAVTLGIMNVSLKEIKFSTSAKDTNDAFFAADTGDECALYNDKLSSTSFVQSGSGIISCLGSSNVPLSGGYPNWSFVLSGLGSSLQGCVKVNVDKNNSGSCGLSTCITSRGYNNGGSGSSPNWTCTPSANTVERELQVAFNENSPVIPPSPSPSPSPPPPPPPPPTFSATGGTITYTDSNTIHTFKSSGTFVVTGSGNVKVLVVGGGGGGGYSGGGGGAGGYRYNASYFASGTITVTIGGGGAGGVNYSVAHTGENSVFGSITSAGGGGGGGYSNPDGVTGANGGSGGGGGLSEGGGDSPGGVGNTPSTSPSQGNDGGHASNWSDGGGGGGANAVGTSDGNGGNGKANSIVGSTEGQNIAGTYYLSGGGGGSNSLATIHAGGNGGGGNGGKYSDRTDGIAGSANTGGGGGGSFDKNGKGGGSGIVIISYPTP